MVFNQSPTYSQPVQGVAFPSPRLRARENDTRGGTLLAGGASAPAGECAANQSPIMGILGR